MPPPAPDLATRFLCDEDGLLAVDKPPGITSTGKRLSDTDCLQWLLMQRYGTVWAVHQLDKETSGVNLFVRRRRLVEACRQRMAPPAGEKTYLALCQGVPERDAWRIEVPIGWIDAQQGHLGVVAGGKPAATRVQVLARGPDLAALVVRLETGRTHQVRIHLAHAGHPLLGEAWYCRPACRRAPRQALHAWRLRLGGPEPRTFTAPIPADLAALAREAALVLPGEPPDEDVTPLS